MAKYYEKPNLVQVKGSLEIPTVPRRCISTNNSFPLFGKRQHGMMQFNRFLNPDSRLVTPFKDAKGILDIVIICIYRKPGDDYNF